MDLQENYVITSDTGIASNFISNFAFPVRLQQGHKIALKSIFYGPRFNVTDKNNKIYLKIDEKVPANAIIENGWYPDVYSLFIAIAKAIDKWIDIFNTEHVDPQFSVELENCDVTYLSATQSVILTLDDTIYMEHSIKHSDVLDLLELTHGNHNKIDSYNTYFSYQYPAFLYCSIVENSYLNNRASRHLALLPLRSGHADGTDGHHFYEFINPTFYRFGVSEFSQVKFEIRDLDGMLVEFDPSYKTLLTLEIFKPLNLRL